MQNLLTLCTTAACDSERAYVGTMVGGSGVYMDQRHKWHNAEYLEHTMVQTYLPYALGGGYILSLDVIKVCLCLPLVLVRLRCTAILMRKVVACSESCNA
jgi:hypothetical protein